MKKVLSSAILLIISTIIAVAQFSVAEIDINHVSCNGALTGEVTISVTGGTGPYDYYLLGGGSHEALGVSDTFQTFSGLSARGYTILVEQSSGPNVSDFIEILQPFPISITSATFTPITCNGFNDGIINVSATGESGTHTYTLNPGGVSQPSGYFTGLSPDNYTVTVTDAGTCLSSDVSGVFNLSDPLPVSILSESSQDISCFGAIDGEVNVKAQGGTTPYTYTLNPGAAQINGTGFFNSLNQGIYKVEVTDINNCAPATSSDLLVQEPAELKILTENAFDVSCNGSTDGSVIVTAGGGSGTYIYTLSGGGGSNGTGSFSSLAPGTFTVSVQDSKGCGPVVSNDLVVGEPAPIIVSALGSDDITCFNNNDGKVSITAAGGTAPYDYTLSNGANNNTGVFTGLPGGTYTVNITDASACPILTSNPVTIVNPPAISLQSESTKGISCFGTNDAEIHVKAQGGTGTLYYTLVPDGSLTNTSGDFTGITPGTYNVSVTDDNSCPSTNSGPHTFIEPAPIVASVNATSKLNLNCFGDTDGTINLDISGGTSPFNYSWTGPGGFVSSDKDLSNLLPGTYNVIIIDANLCSENYPAIATVSEPAALGLSLVKTDVVCNDDDNGTITVTPSGGTAPYVYTLSNGANNSTGTFTGLPGGTYTVDITDAAVCPVVTSNPVTILNPPAISLQSESTKEIACFGSDNAEIHVKGQGGTGVLHYTLIPDGSLTNTSGDFTGITPGTYNVSFTDDNLCPAANSGPHTFIEPTPITASVNASSKLVLNCFGDTDGTVNLDVSGGTGPYTYSWTGPGGFVSSSKNITNLLPGTYSVIIKDANLCSGNYPDIATVSEPPVLDLSLAKTDVVCNGDADGTITVTPSGGTPSYLYSKNGIVYQPSLLFSNLGQNTYTIYIKDSKNCIKSDIITINEPLKLSLAQESRADNNLCYGDSLGEISIDKVTGGVPNYQYSINGGTTFSGNPLFTNLPAGTYATAVKDQNGCVALGNPGIVINQPDSIKITTLLTVDVTGCYGNTNGTIFIDATGGTSTKNYSLDGGTFITPGNFTGIGGGSHEITIRDLNLCEKKTSVFIDQPLKLVFTSLNKTDIIDCFGDATGEISVTTAGGTGLHNYTIDGGAFVPSGIFTGLLAGDHTLSVKDANDCPLDTLINLTEPEALAILSTTPVDAGCTGSNDGKITVVATGGTGPYQYTLNPGAVSNSSGLFENLTPDNYTISVDDAKLCGPVTTGSISISDPLPIMLESLNSNEIICKGDNNAGISLAVSGGTAPYEYSIDDESSYGSIADFTGLTPGSYHISARDAQNCVLYIDTLTFTDPLPIILNTQTITDVNGCFGEETGSIKYELSGGVGVIEYSIDTGLNWQASPDFLGLGAGDYLITARDERACEHLSPELSITQPQEITADISSTRYYDPTQKGTITIANASGGTGTLEFSIGGTGGTFSSDTYYEDLDPDSYDVVVKDAKDCKLEETVIITAVPPLLVSVSKDNVTCHGDTDGKITLTPENATGQVQFSIDDSASWQLTGIYDLLAPGDYSVYVKDEDNRYFHLNINIAEPNQLSILSEVTRPSCSSFSGDGEIDVTIVGAQGIVTYSWSNGAITEDLFNIDGGSYTLDIFDQKACSTSKVIEVIGVEIVEAIPGPDTVVCKGSELILNGQGGSTVSWTPISGLSNPNIPNPVATIDSSITYTLMVVGSGDCYDIDSITISTYPELGLSAGNDTAVYENGSVEINALGGPFVNYSWLPTTGVDDPTSASVTITPPQTSTYIVSATDENGCVEADTLMISMVDKLVVYNSFSPDLDGTNDFWDIDNAEYYPKILVEVYNRWGEKLFSTTGYTSDKRWDGKYKGKDAPIGTYYYVIVPYSGAKAITGPLTIVR